MKLALLGNSHLACLKNAWDEGGGPAGVQPVFFAASGGQPALLRAEGTSLVTDDAPLRRSLAYTSGGLDTIDTTEYDVFVLVGLSVAATPLLRVYELYASESQASPVVGRRRVSDALFEELAWATRRRAAAYGLARTIAGLTSKPVLVVPQPMPSESLLTSQDVRSARWSPLREHGDEAYLSRVCAELDSRMSDSQVRVVAQAPGTLASPLFTAAQYSVGSRGLTGAAHGDVDHFHMNAAYGRVVLDELLKVGAVP